jgi:hypothetical protein
MRNRLGTLLLAVSLSVSAVFGASLLAAPPAAAATFNYTGATCSVTPVQPVILANNYMRVQGSAWCSVSFSMHIDVFTQEYTTAGWRSFTVQSASNTGSVSTTYSMAPVREYYYRTSVNWFIWNGSGWQFIYTFNSPSTYLP